METMIDDMIPEPASEEALPRVLNNREDAGYVINPEKRELITVGGRYYRRMAIRTHVLTRDDNLAEEVRRYAEPLLSCRAISSSFRKRRSPVPSTARSR